MIVSKMEAQNQKERLEGFQEAIAQYPELKIRKILEGNSDVRVLNERISRMLEEEQDLTAVFCAEGYGTTSIAQIIKDAKDYCSSSAGLELPMQMTGILRMYLKMLHVKWRHLVSAKRRICGLKM